VARGSWTQVFEVDAGRRKCGFFVSGHGHGYESRYLRLRCRRFPTRRHFREGWNPVIMTVYGETSSGMGINLEDNMREAGQYRVDSPVRHDRPLPGCFTRLVAGFPPSRERRWGVGGKDGGGIRGNDGVYICANPGKVRRMNRPKAFVTRRNTRCLLRPHFITSTFLVPVHPCAGARFPQVWGIEYTLE